MHSLASGLKCFGQFLVTFNIQWRHPAIESIFNAKAEAAAAAAAGAETSLTERHTRVNPFDGGPSWPESSY